MYNLLFVCLFAAMSSLRRLHKSSLGSSYVNLTVHVPVYTVLKAVREDSLSTFAIMLHIYNVYGCLSIIPATYLSANGSGVC